MTGADVAELYRFLESHPDLFTNGIRQWQQMRAREGVGVMSKEEEVKVGIAIGRFKRMVS